MIHGFYGVLCNFLRICERFDRRYLLVITVRGDEVLVRLVCLDPSYLLDQSLRRARGALFFSATLTPVEYFADMLGGGKDALQLSLPSPFSPSHFCVAVADGVSTRSEDRDKSAARAAAYLAAAVSGKRGNYLAFFPSYSYLETVLKVFSRRYPKVETVVQTRTMSQADREAFLARFEPGGGKLRVGFCVLGGAFSEGVDLPGDRLIGVVVVGLGLPAISDERNILSGYYEETRGCGFDYAYTYPGMNHVLQAAGRVIRTEEDRGILVLIDDRYASERYLRLFPPHWKNLQCTGTPQGLAVILRRFWRQVAEETAGTETEG
jgi:Rad3-related DNA helicase